MSCSINRRMKSVDRAINILDHICVNGPSGITEMSVSTGISKSTIHRIVGSLEYANWVQKNKQSDKYFLSKGALEFSINTISAVEIRSSSMAFLYELRDISGETATLTLRVGFERMYLEQVPSRQEVRRLMQIGKRYPLWIGSPGKVILANMKNCEIEEVLRGGIDLHYSDRVFSVDAIRKELTQAREEGWLFCSSERVEATSGMSAPIFDSHGTVIGSIGITGPLPRFRYEVAKHYANILKDAARQILI